MLGGPVAGHMQHLGKLFTKELQEPGANRVRLAQLYVQGVRAIFRKFNVKPIALFAVPLTQIATLLTFVYATRHLVMHGALDLSDQGALWFMDLSAKDTTMLLPLVAVSLSYTTLERSFGRTVQVPGQPVSVTAGDVVREVLQAMLVFGFPFIAQLPSGIFMYWIPSSAFGFCQNTLLKLPSVRAALGLTDPPRLNATPIVQQVPKSAVVSKHRPTSSASGASRSQDAGVTCEHEAEELRASLEQLRERAVCVGPDEKLHVDTMVKHATWQRVSLDVAVATHTDQIAAADAKAAAARDEIAEIDQELTTHAANVIQSCLRGVLKRTEPERTERAKVEQNNTGSAVTIQRVFRGVLGRRYVALVRHRRREAAAIFVQRVWRGYKGRIRALNIESIRAEQARLEAAIRIQRFWSDSKQASIVRAQKQAVLAAKEADLQHQQAVTIQRIVRGYLAREQKRCRRVELKLGPRVRELANRYIARGDLYSFLQAVNRDYELHMAQQAELRKMELENAATFIEEVLAHRDQEVQARWREWERQKLALRNTDEAIQIYGPGKLRDAEAAAYAVPEVPQMVSIPSRKAVVKDPISRTSAKGPSALDVVAPSQSNNQLTAQDFAFAPYATQLRATEVPHMDVPLDNLVFQAALREYIGQIRFGEPGRSRDAIMEHFILSAPATLRIAAEEEALQVSTPIISALRSRDVLTCRELLQVAERLETDYMVPPALASTIRSLLGAAVRNISNTRPASQHLKMEMDMKDDTYAQILEIDQDDLNLRLMGHFGVSDTSRPVSSAETICYEESSSPMLSDRNTFDQTSDTRQPTAQGGNGEIACQARPKTSGGLFESSLRPGTSALREWDWRAPMGLPIEFVEVRPFTAGPIADGISTANLERRPSTQSSSATGSSAGTRVTFAPNVTDRPSTQASAFSSLSDVSRPPSRASYASTVGTVDWNHASEDKATALEGSDIQIWTADIGRSNDDNDDDDDNRESAVEKEAKKDDSRNGNCATNDNGLSQKQSRQFAQQAQLLAVSTPQLDSSIHDLLIHILLTGPPEGFEAYGLEDLARELAKLPPEAEAARREMARAHYRAVRSEASTLAKPLSRAGFEEVHALAACPLSSFAIPREIVAVLQSRFQEISSAGDDSSRPFDARLCRSGVGTLGHARYRKEGLSPVRMDRARHYADGTMDFPISAKSGPRREQLVERILHRAEDLARATAVPVAKASAEDAMERNYHEWKRGPKVGLNAIVTTHEEAASLVGWHPFPQG
ncbi:Mitochondrial inner membrane protein OXA1L [Hondaea fermentalgiana]|uniref:Mitochondrial inner membrane protein OXA1L n=1 Tax=Hondaea fermentalgiana TaxID=2315210 RepID=A0A2R5GFF0_9STRA|nr:Mitochondrial inner membrane protein OXA1L [Hondaea fermentalgiana]|eukprot:GBG29640.1 Mitochondrial inner membrane protein OXA1L [Hondaea fermentalgiana]